MGINFFKNLFPFSITLFIDCKYAVMGNCPAQRTCYIFHRIGKCLLCSHAFLHDKTAVKRFHYAVHRTKQNAAFAKNITAVFTPQGGHKDIGRANSYCPAKGLIRGLAVNILLNCKACINTGTVYLLALYIQPADGRPHTLGTHTYHIDIFREIFIDAFKMPQKETMGKSQGGTILHGGKYLLIMINLGCIGNQQEHHIGLGNHFVHLAKGTGLLCKTCFPGTGH